MLAAPGPSPSPAPEVAGGSSQPHRAVGKEGPPSCTGGSSLQGWEHRLMREDTGPKCITKCTSSVFAKVRETGQPRGALSSHGRSEKGLERGGGAEDGLLDFLPRGGFSSDAC